LRHQLLCVATVEESIIAHTTELTINNENVLSRPKNHVRDGIGERSSRNSMPKREPTVRICTNVVIQFSSCSRRLLSKVEREIIPPVVFEPTWFAVRSLLYLTYLYLMVVEPIIFKMFFVNYF
jgi:hypothetical protein